MKLQLFAAAALLAGIVMTVHAAEEAPKNYLITFGDSYSKTGFHPDLNQPSPSNPLGNPDLPGETSAGGRNWIGWMVTEFTNSWGTSNSSITLSYNFASSGSTVDKNLVRARDDDFQDQVDLFSRHYGNGQHPWTAENAVVGIWYGVNDIRRSFSRNNAGDLVTSILRSYFDNLEKLYIIGMRKYVLLSVPPLSMVPDMQNLHDRGISELNSAVEIWNNLLREMLLVFKEAHEDVVAQVVDTSLTFWAGVEDPDAFGAMDTVCKNEDGESCLWWDGGHPATKIERLVAAEVAKTLNSEEFQCYGNAFIPVSTPAMALSENSSLFAHLLEIYGKYRQTQDPQEKGQFFSPECHQICRQDPSYAATNRDTIVRYLRESGEMVSRIIREAGWEDENPGGGLTVKASYYTARPFTDNEASEFATEEVVVPAGFSSVDELRSRAKAEDWTGLRVNMWTDDGQGRGLLVKVKYWWRLEQAEKEDGGEGVWRQILHDILYLGPLDGTEESDGGTRIQD